MFKIIGKQFSSVATVSRIFYLGFRDLTKETAHWFKLKKRVWQSSDGVQGLDRKELDVYYRVPKEFKKVAPTILISALPFANYVMLPIAYYFPKHLLSSHFWTLQQKSEFPVEILQQKQKYYKPVFRIMQARLHKIKDDRQRALFQTAVYKLGSGSQPTCQEILEIKDLFATDIFSIRNITRTHAKGLCRLHDVHNGVFLRRRKLFKTAEMIHCLDMAIKKEGLSELKSDELRSACFLRGLNGSNSSEEDMEAYMTQWISVTTVLDPSAFSLILHLPIFLGYNNVNNRAVRL